ncbi:MAG: RNA polymerase factor sigma-54 [Bacteroidaceae bacterium]|nr:RNA polymerase factor sigma-54 [Bacteroidaceae bacterium]
MLTQTTTLEQRQVQRLTPQQVQLSRLIEMPVEALYDEVDKELKENPSLEAMDDDNLNTYDDTGNEAEDTDKADETDWTSDADMSDISDAAADYMPDDVPDNLPSARGSMEAVTSDTLSFYNYLSEQIGFYTTSDRQKELIQYLIGSLDERGWLPVSLQQIQDELEVYHNMSVETAELEEALNTLQHLEPAGIGARNLQECLLLQVERGQEQQLLQRLLTENFDLLMLNRWDKIAQRMHLTDAEVHRLQRELRRLNPRPGSAMDEAQGKSLQQITPDFIVETDYYGQISISLNNGHVPPLHINSEDKETLAAYNKLDSKTMNRSQREAQTFLRDNVNRAESFIESLKIRQNSLLLTMRAIVKLQHTFFETGDETTLRPMTLDDISRMTNLHISTVSRVTASKWVQTIFGIYPLRWFFSSASQLDGEEVSVRKAEATLLEIVGNEDKTKPLTDDEIAMMMQKQGFDVARRTVSKYRDRVGIPVARLRKKSVFVKPKE